MQTGGTAYSSKAYYPDGVAIPKANLLLLEPRSDPRGKDLRKAAKKGKLDEMLRLLDQGIHIECRDTGIAMLSSTVGWSALHFAVHEGHLACVNALLSRGADVNALVVRGTPVCRL